MTGRNQSTIKDHPVLPAIVLLSPFHNVDFMCGVKTSHVVPKRRYETATQFLPARKTLTYLHSSMTDKDIARLNRVFPTELL